MSNKTQLQTNNTALDGYIARINAAKDVAAGLPEAGGGSIETCTVTLTHVCSGSYAPNVICGYMQFIDGIITINSVVLLNGKSVVIENVVQRSLVAITIVNGAYQYSISSFSIDNMLDEDYDDTYLFLQAWGYGGNECSCTIYTDN